MSGYTDTYYSRTLNDDRARPALEGRVDADVCIIGGGLAGVSTALSLAERGVRAVVLEGRRIGFGASGRNGGKALTGFSASHQKIINRVGLPHMKALHDLTKEALPLVRARIEKYKISCDVREGVILISCYDDPDALKREMAFDTDTLGLNVEFVERGRLREMYRSQHYYDALLYHDWFHMHPLNYLHGIAAAFEAQGGRIFEDTMALKVRRQSGEHIVFTARGQVRAQHVVYCGSAYFNGIEPRLSWASLPVSSYMTVTKPLLRPQLESAIRAPYGVYDDRWACDYYRILPDTTRLLWGGGVGIGTMKTPPGLEARILGNIIRAYPQLAGIVELDCAWVGTMSSTVHRMPHIGRLEDTVWFNTNYGNNGLGPTAAGGECIAAAIARKDETYKLFAPFGLEYTGGALGPYVAQAVYRYWQLRDRLDQWRQAMKQKKP